MYVSYLFFFDGIIVKFLNYLFFYDIILIYVFLKYLIVLRSRGNGQKDTREEYEESTIKRM